METLNSKQVAVLETQSDRRHNSQVLDRSIVHCKTIQIGDKNS